MMDQGERVTPAESGDAPWVLGYDKDGLAISRGATPDELVKYGFPTIVKGHVTRSSGPIEHTTVYEADAALPTAGTIGLNRGPGGVVQSAGPFRSLAT